MKCVYIRKKSMIDQEFLEKYICSYISRRQNNTLSYINWQFMKDAYISKKLTSS